MKLADMMGGNTCSDIVPGRTNMDVEKTRQQEQEKLEQRIKEILREQQPASKKLDIIWIAPPVINTPKIRINKHNLVFINKLAVESAPNKYHQGFKARIGIDETQKILVVQPSEEGEYVFRKYRTAIVMTSRALGRQIQKRGIALPAEFAAPWDKDLQAWMGQLIREE